MPGQSRRQVSEVSALDLISHPLSGQPFGSSLDLCLCLVVLVWALSLVTGDCSEWLDRLWALTPPACCLALVLTGGFDAVRVNVMTALAFLWAARMTFNFVRKGGYRKSYRDYRWESLKERIGPLRYRLLSIVLFTPSQLLLPWLFTSPVHQAWVWKSQPLGWLDGLALLLFLAGFCGESISDQQMWAFQQDKKRRVAAGEKVVQPFITTGLFRYSRHPSYLCEIGMWSAFNLFAVSASGQWLHWTGLGIALLSMQLLGVIRMTERLSEKKYPAYARYKSRTPALLPFRVRIPLETHEPKI